MRRTRNTGSLSLVYPLAEPERYARARLFFHRIKRAMAENQNQRPLKDFCHTVNWTLLDF